MSDALAKSGPPATFVPPPQRPVEVRPFAQFFMSLASYGKPQYDLGDTPAGHFNLGVITGGWITGDRLNARVLNGIDYGLRRTDDTHVPTIGIICETDDGDLFLMSYSGLISPFSEVGKARRGEPYDPDIINWKILVTFTTSAPAIEWLNRTQVVGRGTVVDGGFHYWAYELD
ncbi:MAG TPA: DUF3237 family protein [Pseudolysinimonas sp.]|nr:DUF3237 family protein [Pseudolysinimonas sp.]